MSEALLEMQGDTWEIHGRYMGDTGEIQAR